ncbi:hypothetical protein [Ferroplasma sp.]|uniref:hypothetical protein n=1 Tax=Ferroplasma sp. TaxID=2591003 RepID=UPI00307D7B38
MSNISWSTACAIALADGKIDLPKEMEDPLETGLFFRSIGKIRGQVRDYRCSIDGSKLGIHVVEFIDHYEVHVDKFDPHKKPLEHIVFDSPDTILKIPLLLKIIKKN